MFGSPGIDITLHLFSFFLNFSERFDKPLFGLNLYDVWIQVFDYHLGWSTNISNIYEKAWVSKSSFWLISHTNCSIKRPSYRVKKFSTISLFLPRKISWPKVCWCFIFKRFIKIISKFLNFQHGTFYLPVRSIDTNRFIYPPNLCWQLSKIFFRARLEMGNAKMISRTRVISSVLKIQKLTCFWIFTEMSICVCYL